jgi:hypothetical protein
MCGDTISLDACDGRKGHEVESAGSKGEEHLQLGLSHCQSNKFEEVHDKRCDDHGAGTPQGRKHRHHHHLHETSTVGVQTPCIHFVRAANGLMFSHTEATDLYSQVILCCMARCSCARWATSSIQAFLQTSVAICRFRNTFQDTHFSLMSGTGCSATHVSVFAPWKETPSISQN